MFSQEGHKFSVGPPGGGPDYQLLELVPIQATYTPPAPVLLLQVPYCRWMSSLPIFKMWPGTSTDRAVPERNDD